MVYPDSSQHKYQWRLGAYRAKAVQKPQAHSFQELNCPHGHTDCECSGDSTQEAAQVPLLEIQRMNNDSGYLDPLNSYPIVTDVNVQKMLDYHFQALAPIYGPEFLVDDHWNPLLSILFPMALQSPLLFRATVVGTRSVLLASAGQSLEHDTILMYQMGLLLRQVQEALWSGQTMNLELILATTWMTLSELLLNKVEAAVTHLLGFAQLWKLLPPQAHDINTPLGQFLYGISRLKEYCAAYLVMTKAPGSEALKEILEERLLTYPAISLSDDDLSRVCELPAGFALVAIGGEVSYEVMDDVAHLEMFTAAARAGQPVTQIGDLQLTTVGDNVRDHFVSPMSMQIERYLLQGLLSFTLQLEVEYSLISHATGQTTVGMWLRMFPAWSNFPHNQSHDSLLWSCISFIGVSELFLGQQQSTDNLMERLVENPALPNAWEDVEEILKRFLWTDIMLIRWKKSWDAAVLRRQKAAAEGKVVPPSRTIVPAARQQGYRVPVAATCSLVTFIIRRRGIPIQ